LLLQVAGEHVDVFGGKEEAAKLAKEADAAGARFRGILGTAPLRGAILVGKEMKSGPEHAKNGAKWIWTWDPSGLYEGAFAHELGHFWLIYWADGTQAKLTGYGSSLPDWIDEGFASLFDPPELRRSYAAEMKRRIAAGTHLKLEDLFGLLHPDSRGKGDRCRDRFLFYAQSWSVAAWLEEKGTLGRVLKDLKAGKKPAAADLEPGWTEWAGK
jgi:hypothetical protein